MYKIEYANYNHYLCYVISVSLQETQIKKFSPAGNRTPVSRVTGGDTNHYTTEDRLDCVMLWQATVRRNEARQGHNFVMCACLMTSYSKVSTWWTLLTHDETPCTVLNCRKEKAIKKMGVWRARRNASSFLSVRLFLCMEQLDSHRTDFHEI